MSKLIELCSFNKMDWLSENVACLDGACWSLRDKPMHYAILNDTVTSSYSGALLLFLHGFFILYYFRCFCRPPSLWKRWWFEWQRSKESRQVRSALGARGHRWLSGWQEEALFVGSRCPVLFQPNRFLSSHCCALLATGWPCWQQTTEPYDLISAGFDLLPFFLLSALWNQAGHCPITPRRNKECVSLLKPPIPTHTCTHTGTLTLFKTCFLVFIVYGSVRTEKFFFSAVC